MQPYLLANGSFLTIEPDGKKRRLVISNGQEELACRKETPGKLRRFIQSEELSLFRGRLQLRKSEGQLSIILKGEEIGVIELEEFAKMVSPPAP